jgi:riboflavin biosynthesis pyrimidine reductase
MGAWGNHNFDNDQAMDFVGDFIDNPSLESLVEVLTTVVDLGKDGEYIEVDEASAALAAAEIIAAVLKKPAVDFPAELQPVLASIHSTTIIQKLARKAVKQVLGKSELQELWAEGGDSTGWQTIQEDLLNRLK